MAVKPLGRSVSGSGTYGSEDLESDSFKLPFLHLIWMSLYASDMYASSVKTVV